MSLTVIKHIICELTGYRPGTVDVSQGDRGSRAVSCRLMENGAPWMIPEGATARVSYTLPDGTEGLYDRRPDGTPMWEITKNIVTVELADQLMAQAGMVQMSILIIGPEGGQLATWPIRVMVIADKAARLTVPEEMPPYGAGFAGKIFFGGEDGTVTPLGIGAGVEIVRQEDGTFALVAYGGSGGGGGITEEKDPTVYEWAKQPQKPAYTAQEVGALPKDTKIPGRTSELTNDAGFVTKAVSDLANYYTRTQTQELIAAIPRFRVTVVQQLPAAGEDLVLYLVPFATAEGQYLEYIWVDGRWEIIGSQRVDLTGYATEVWVKDYVAEHSGQNVNRVEPAEDDTPCVYLYTGGVGMPFSKDEGEKQIRMVYESKTQTENYYLTAKVQGSSSASNPNYKKRNWTFKFYTDSTYEKKLKLSFKEWPAMNKFVLKAGWVIPGHLRNVGAAKVWGQIMRTRADFDSLPEELRNSPNLGATDGFHVRVFVDGMYWGIYDWIVAKDQLFGQDKDNPAHSILNSELNNQPTCAFATTSPAINGNWSEELLDDMTADTKTSMENWIKFVAGATDEEFVANAENYFDVQSVIDAICFDRIILTVDNMCRNQIVFKYDKKWYMGKWDLDAILGLPPVAGQAWFAYNTEYQEGYVAYKDYGVINMLYKRTEELFLERFKARYLELRNGPLSENNLVRVFGQLSDRLRSIEGLLSEENAATTGNGQFTAMPNVDKDTIYQIREFVVKRCSYMDSVINGMEGGAGGGPGEDTGGDTGGIGGVADNFATSAWTSGYYDDTGVVTNVQTMHHSDLLAVGDYVVKVSDTVTRPFLRISYFNESGDYAGYDRGEGLNVVPSAENAWEISVNPEYGAYFAVNANTDDKSKVSVSAPGEDTGGDTGGDAGGDAGGIGEIELTGAFVPGFVNGITGEIGNTNNCVAYEGYIAVSANTQYRIECTADTASRTQVVFYGSDKAVVSYKADIPLPATFMTPEACSFVRFHIMGGVDVIQTAVTTDNCKLFKVG